jgi:hypothetical protein
MEDTWGANAHAIAKRLEVLLADEPTGAFDCPLSADKPSPEKRGYRKLGISQSRLREDET